ncbi:MAG: hypothetical protein GEU93_03600 [Propionibacteriales bacterium]|nr:hypothetical protein [Propionibacteriales bacterium]
MGGAGERITDPDVYWYWFIVTAATVGYGDYTPTTTEGYLVSIYVIIGGVATITTLFARIAQTIDNAKGRRMLGRQELRVSGHIVVLGYVPGRTETIIDRLVAEESREIVVCAWEDQVEEHPVAHREDVHFVRGNLTDDDVLHRAAVSEAAAVLVDGRDDYVARRRLRPRDLERYVDRAERALIFSERELLRSEWH